MSVPRKRYAKEEQKVTINGRESEKDGGGVGGAVAAGKALSGDGGASL